MQNVFAPINMGTFRVKIAEIKRKPNGFWRLNSHNISFDFQFITHPCLFHSIQTQIRNPIFKIHL